MSMSARDVTGEIFDIQSYSIHDGPGIRTTVFLKGCPLRCLWCQNPESQHKRPDRVVEQDGSTRVIGRRSTAGEVFDEIAKDEIFYRRSNGGITLSGGEPLAQPDFTRAILELSKEAGFHTAIDTSGYGRWSSVEEIFCLCDLILYDLKHLDLVQHKTITGVSNKPILQNLRKIAKLGVETWIRIPLVSGWNDTDENIKSVCEFVSATIESPRVFLLPYHNFGEGKYLALGRTPPEGFEAPKEKRLSEIKAFMEELGFRVQIGG